MAVLKAATVDRQASSGGEGGALGPRGSYDRGASISPAQSVVLDELALSEAFRLVSDLAETLGQHTNTVREHLDALVAAGLVERQPGRSAGRGRPANRYRARSVEQTQPAVREYAGLASALAEHIARTSANPKAEALAAGVRWGEQLASARVGERDGGPQPGTPTGARRGVVEIMSDLGFAPEADSRAAMVRLRRCPLLETARRHPEVVCAVHLGVARGALSTLGGDPERADLVPFAEVGACRLHLLATGQRAKPKRGARGTP